MKIFSEWLNENWMKDAVYKSPKACVELAKSKGEPQPELESKILEDSNATLKYMRLFYPQGWLEAEPTMMKNSETFLRYAKEILEGRWRDKALSPEGRKAEEYWLKRREEGDADPRDESNLMVYAEIFDIPGWFRALDVIRDLYRKNGEKVTAEELDNIVMSINPSLAGDDFEYYDDVIDLVHDSNWMALQNSPGNFSVDGSNLEFRFGVFDLSESEFIEKIKDARSILITHLSPDPDPGVMDRGSDTISGVINMSKNEYLRKFELLVREDLRKRDLSL